MFSQTAFYCGRYAEPVPGVIAAFERSLIVKRVPPFDAFRCLAAFAKESAAYRALVPALSRACTRAGLALPLARCLRADERPDLIVLEDLGALGYAMRPRLQAQRGFDCPHALRVMEVSSAGFI